WPNLRRAFPSRRLPRGSPARRPRQTSSKPGQAPSFLFSCFCLRKHLGEKGSDFGVSCRELFGAQFRFTHIYGGEDRAPLRWIGNDEIVESPVLAGARLVTGIPGSGQAR